MSTVLVALGTTSSAFWIVTLNSWLPPPAQSAAHFIAVIDALTPQRGGLLLDYEN